MFIISPLFGNYIDIKDFVSVKGSFTAEPRDGLFLQIVKTLRYSFQYDSWINKIGLRNKGIDYAIDKYKNTDHIISIAILKPNDIPVLLSKIPNNMNLEINISCPNLNKKLVSDNINKFIHNERQWCVIKLSPTSTYEDINNLYSKGFRQFHCSNTIPVNEGGLSGKEIKKYNKHLIPYILSFKDTTVIGGGGITSWED